MAGGGIQRVLYLVLAGLFFVLAVLGVLLPVLPTTPFLLLCSYFLARSSPRLLRALERSRLFGPFLRDWKEHGGVRRPVKVWACVCVLTVVGFSLWRAELATFARIALVVLASIGLYVVYRLPVVSPEPRSEPRVVDPPERPTGGEDAIVADVDVPEAESA